MVKARLNAPLELLGEKIFPGERVSNALEVAQLFTQSPLNIPVEIIHGHYKGPILLVCAAIHGDELNGVEAVRQILAKVDAAKLKGTLVAVPVVNVFGFIHKSRYLPDRRDLNRSFPGHERGSLASRFAFQFYQQLARHCTHIVDLHTGAIHRANLPQIRVNMSDPDSAAMAESFGVPVIIDAAIRDGSLRSAAEANDTPVITFEGGEALRFDSLAIASAVDGVIGVMRQLGMLRRVTKRAGRTTLIAQSTSWIRADQDGIVRSKVVLGERVTKGQVLAQISAPSGHGECELVAPKGGIVIGQQTLPLVNEGDAVFHLAYFQKQTEQAEREIGEYIDELADGMDSEAVRLGLPTEFGK